MEKLKYIYPKTEVYVLNTSGLMRAGESSDPSSILPDDPAPRRRTPVF